MDFGDKKKIIQALKEMKYNPRVYVEPRRLRGYKGDTRKQKAEIIVPKEQVGPVSNDIGFELKNGKYILHISEYDKSAKTFDYKKMTSIYNTSKLLAPLKKNPKYHISKKKIRKDGKIELEITLNF
jgi:hypothetical protein